MDERMNDIEKFKKYLQRQYPGRRTAIDYTSDIRQFSAACSKPWREVTMHDIDNFVDQQRQIGRSAATVKRRVASLKTFFDFLAEETGELSWPNPVRFKRHAGKQPQRLPRDLSDEQVEQLWAVITAERDRAWFALMLRSGLRVGEVTQLRITDILQPPTSEQPGQLRACGKGQKERIALLTPDGYAVLQEWLAVGPTSSVDIIFLNQRGQPMSTSGIEWLLDRYSQQALGQHVTPHQLRHTFARQLAEAGMSITSLSKLLGHAQLGTTQVYTAGADPKLVQAYQTAMARLATSIPLAEPQLPPESQPVPQLSPTASILPLSEPDWEKWAVHLPSELRQVSLDMVQHLWPTWKPQRRKEHARRILNQLLGFWEWQLSHRPIISLAELHLTDLQAYQQARTSAGKATSTINRTLRHVMAIVRRQDDQGQPIDASLLRLRPLPRPDSLPRHLSEADSQKLERFVRDRFNRSDPIMRLENACFFVLAHTGLRAGECIDLQRQDLDLNAGRLAVRLGKGQRDRFVPLSQTACLALRIYLGSNNAQPTIPLWLQPTGVPMTRGWQYEHIVALGQTAGGIIVSPNRLRHTLATRLLNIGMDITQIQKLLGHANINTTMVYARVLDKTLEADYRQAMEKIEQQQMPLSTTPEVVNNWPMPEIVDQPHPIEVTSFDNSV